MAFIREHMAMGDPLGTALAPRRKAAASGPRAKAFRKRRIRESRMLRMGGDPFGGMTVQGKEALAKAQRASGFDIGKVMQAAAAKAAPFLKNVLGSGVLGPVGSIAGSLIPATSARGSKASLPPMTGSTISAGALEAMGVDTGGGGSGKRRRINPTNVRALRRSLGRVRGFQGLVKQVNRLLPAGARMKAGGNFPKKRRKK
jgi:hypothetical protein